MKYTKIYLISLIAALTSCVSESRVRDEAGISRLHSLGTGERIELSYSSVGCSGGSRYEIDFISRGGSIVASKRGITHAANPRVRTHRKELILGRTDTKSIDRLFDAYRVKQWENKQRLARRDWKNIEYSTSSEFLTVSKFRGSKRLATEKFSGSTDALNNRTNVMTIPELNARLDKAR